MSQLSLVVANQRSSLSEDLSVVLVQVRVQCSLLLRPRYLDHVISI